ncbi:BTB/POZ domain-containing adapter for CUL3-mediated RhoA degradation protein 3-like isoform X2 [Lycorma delicatula]|uniref:BTB/POZ domain-containing adapter for CUL3-mediated RhoA degradation protein 3-like isoform X2 n=1 Tax=Lycorma delicatula TaxID=130591 RepID=UPI003F510139
MSGDHKTVIKGNPSQYVKLNIGGSLHYTTIGTLTKQDTMLRAMFSGRMEVLTDSEGWILIDRCGKHFGLILHFLQDGSVPLPETSRELAELLAEAKYYCIAELAQACDSALHKRENDAEPICRVPLINSQKEEQLLISSTTKPVVKLLINRHNNKYSYTSTSDDNLLKNIELFDKLSLRFSGRVLFIKDVIGSSEICCWSFYGHGKKVAEVCCTSIVYATDKKHTKCNAAEKSNLNNACSKDARRMHVKRAHESEEQIAARNSAQRIRIAEIRRQESGEQRDECLQQNI